MGERSESVVVPVIDLGEFPTQSGKLLEACESLGCFRVVNHKIPSNLMTQMKSVVRCLLDLPTHIKCRNRDTIPGSGYVGPTAMNPLYDGLGLYDINSSVAIDAFCHQLDATPHQRETINSYAHEVHELAMDIGRKIAEIMGIEGDEFCRGWAVQFRMNKYSFTEECVGSSGVQLHTDTGFLTILQEDECVGGLEIMDNSGTFIAIDPYPGSFLVNLGDLAKAWSNGRLCNLKHRVQCKEGAIRVTIAVFLLGPKEEAMEAPPKLVDADHPRLYLPFTYEEYRKRRLSTGLHAGEALDLYSIQQD